MIKNIIFDFGDVFINLDKITFNQQLKRIAKGEFSDFLQETCNNYEMGKISTEVFVDCFVEKCGNQLEGENTSEKEVSFKNIWNSILLDFPKHRLSFLKALKKSNTYRLFLLSNTNDLHINWIKNNWGSDLYQEFKSCFEQFYLSQEIHLRKPNATLYQFVLNENNLVAEETLFIDDTKENTDAAKQLGIAVWHLDPKNEDVTQLFTKTNLR